MKIKVLWICHFSNKKINSYLSNKNYKELSPWIINLIDIFSEKDDIELHVLAPNLLENKRKQFKKWGITFHFYKTAFILPKFIYNKLRINYHSNFSLIKNEITKHVKKIDPKLIHFHGAENPVYSSSFFQLYNQFPIFLTIQGFINQDEIANNYIVNQRKQIEKSILIKNTHFGVRTKEMCDYIKKFNNNAEFHWHNYPITLPKFTINTEVEKSYDCVFFGRVVPENGIEDLLHAISIIKIDNNNISLVVVGPIPDLFLNQLLELVKKLNIENNVTFTGYLSTQNEAFEIVAKAKIDVLPTHYDIIPGTILECMYIGVPVISNSVGGIPDLNDNNECIVLSKKGDIPGLASLITDLLNNDEKRKKLISNSKAEVKKFYDKNEIYKDILTIYHNVLEDEKNDK